jgi:hypothetical protein
MYSGVKGGGMVLTSRETAPHGLAEPATSTPPLGHMSVAGPALHDAPAAADYVAAR